MDSLDGKFVYAYGPRPYYRSASIFLYGVILPRLNEPGRVIDQDFGAGPPRGWLWKNDQITCEAVLG